MIESIQNSDTENRIIITSRYKLDFELISRNFFIQEIPPLYGADLKKKIKRLDNFSSPDIDEALKTKAKEVAQGNPRLLEWLNKEILSQEKTQAERYLKEYRDNREPWERQIIWELLRKHIESDEELQKKLLSYCLLVEVPVPKSVLRTAVEIVPNYQEELERAINLGLINVYSSGIIGSSKEEKDYKLSRILPNIFPLIKLPRIDNVRRYSRKVHNQLFDEWGKQTNRNLEKWQEIFRLLFIDNPDIEIFRLGFSNMFSVQYNLEADQAFTEQIEKSEYQLPQKNIFSKLKEYLEKGNWKEADKETAFLFYLIKSKCEENPLSWNVLDDLPDAFIHEIDNLWDENSNQRFGFRIQKNILETIGECKYPLEVNSWLLFGKKVGWASGPWSKFIWKPYSELSFSEKGSLPALWSYISFGQGLYLEKYNGENLGRGSSFQDIVKWFETI